MKVIATILFSIVLYSQCFAQVELSYYLPDDITYDSQIPTPKQVVGHEVGEWHITHDRLVYFMRALSEQSDRVTLIETGKTHEERPQLLLTITSPENHAKIDEIRTEHKKLTDPSVSDQLDLSTMPVVVWQGYGIHGDEASGSNASMLTAYHYAAAQGEAIDELLENTIILLDPSFNPDGLTRFSTWVNSRKSKNQVTDPNNQEQNQFWPRGRTNHYWFDLNRDWLPVQQPESQNRVVQFHAWKPNVLTDHHEMGTNSTFFFQPGIPSRNNPNTPSNTIRLTEEMAKYHSAALDKIGSLYYAKESFDDFYYGKGSTFPDINGAVGILFEQASARSHAQESDHGILTFPFAIRNQFVTSLSTTEAALALREDLLQHQRDFFKSAINTAQKDSKKGIIFGSVDKSAAKELAHIMDQHEIEVYEVEKATSVQGYTYSPGSAYYVPLNQPQYKLIRIMFDKVTSFQDSLFYDVSAWTLPLAFNQQYTYLDVKQSNTISRGNRVSFDIENSLVEKSEYAYVFEWDDYYAPKMLASLLSNGIRAKVSAQPFAYKNRNFDYGSIMIPVQNQTMDAQQIYDLMVEMQKKTGIDVYSVPTGWTSGINLGSPQIRNVRKPSIALLVEEGVSAYDAGEVWHLLDNRFDLNVSLIPIRVLNKIQLERYNTIIMVNGSYGSIASSTINRLKTWVRAGGNIVAFKSANRWLNQQGFTKLKFTKAYQDTLGTKDYQDLSKYKGAQVTGGTIFSGRVDKTHPIGFGYAYSKLPVFVNGNLYFDQPNNPYASPFIFSETPLESGYVSEENLDRLKSSPGIVISKMGSGKIVSFAFNTNFRAFWYGTNKLLLNAIFFGEVIDNRSAE